MLCNREQDLAQLSLSFYLYINYNFPLEYSQIDTTLNNLGDCGVPDFFTWLGSISLACLSPFEDLQIRSNSDGQEGQILLLFSPFMPLVHTVP